MTLPEAAVLADVETAAVDIARVAGARALDAFRASLALEFKGKQQDDPVTLADREIETFLRQELRAHFPTHGLVGEEGEDDVAAGAEFVWALDPLDGTANFASGLPLWGVSMGLLHQGRPVVGCIWTPLGPTQAPGVYHARVGGGAWFDATPVSVSSGDDQRGRIMALPSGYPHTFRMRRTPRGTPRAERRLPDARSLGSCTAELVEVAHGALRATVFVKPSIWDVAAGALIVREAGGSVVTWQAGGWSPFERFDPTPPEKGDAAPSLRHWGRPMIAGAPGVVERLTQRLAWQPRIPSKLKRLLGLASD